MVVKTPVALRSYILGLGASHSGAETFRAISPNKISTYSHERGRMLGAFAGTGKRLHESLVILAAPPFPV